MSAKYAEVIIPVAQKSCYTYKIPDTLVGKLKVGQRVIVVLNKNLKSGIVLEIHEQTPVYETKELYSIWDTNEILVSHFHLKLWKWVSSYYMCELGEVMAVALPSAFRLESESLMSLEKKDYQTENTVEEDVFDRLLSTQTISLSDLVGKNKKQLTFLNKLIAEGVVSQRTKHKQKFIPKKRKYLIPKKELSLDEQEKLSSLQKKVLSRLIEMSESQIVERTVFLKKEGITLSPINTLIKRGLVSSEERIVDRHIFHLSKERRALNVLSESQNLALEQIKKSFEIYPTVLLHGVTSSGKTEIYMHLVAEELKKGKSVLYLLPEIALTTQLAQRLALHFGRKVLVYHSKYNDNERFEIWKKVASQKEPYLVVGTRSAVFLPFKNMGIIIIDEEHERSFKQQSPSPLYHGRDVAVYLGHLYDAKVLLGSGTPSLESYFNVYLKKYGLVKLFSRYKGIEAPDIVIADMSEASRKKRMKGALTPVLYNAINESLERGEQVILFQNRRGYSYFVRCEKCGEVPQCPNCDVSLSLHKYSQMLRCHYCDFQIHYNTYKCPSCTHTEFKPFGMGTQRLEEQLQGLFSSYKVSRFDWDTTSGKYAYERLLQSFEMGEIDILIGTQMLAKGIDFHNVGLVGVLNADLLLHFPDFRSFEHSFQMLLQVSGRAGRKHKQGKVIIQTYEPDHPVLKVVKSNNYKGLYNSQITERDTFGYPPVYRMIKIVLKHKDRNRVQETANVLGQLLQNIFGKRTYGATIPLVGRVSGYFIREIILKIERKSSYAKAKRLINDTIIQIRTEKKHRSVRIICNVDV